MSVTVLFICAIPCVRLLMLVVILFANEGNLNLMSSATIKIHVAELIGNVTVSKRGLALSIMRPRSYQVNEASYLEIDVNDYSENFFYIIVYQDGVCSLYFLQLNNYSNLDNRYKVVFETRTFKFYKKDGKYYIPFSKGNTRIDILSISQVDFTSNLIGGTFNTSGATEIPKVK